MIAVADAHQQASPFQAILMGTFALALGAGGMIFALSQRRDRGRWDKWRRSPLRWWAAQPWWWNLAVSGAMFGAGLYIVLSAFVALVGA